MSLDADRSDLEEEDRLRRPRVEAVVVARGGDRRDEDATGNGDLAAMGDTASGAQQDRPVGVTGGAMIGLVQIRRSDWRWTTTPGERVVTTAMMLPCLWVNASRNVRPQLHCGLLASWSHVLATLMVLDEDDSASSENREWA